MEFRPFSKIPRLRRGMVITEKIDGTNASVSIDPGYPDEPNVIATARIDGTDMNMRAGSRTRWLTPQDDNFGFAAWAQKNADELFALGPGHHFGEWYGRGIQRGYGMTDRAFALFNVGLWIEVESDRTNEAQRVVPAPVKVVPVLARSDVFDTNIIDVAIERLQQHGSRIAPGYMKPEGIVIFHEAGGYLFKRTIEKDDQPKGA